MKKLYIFVFLLLNLLNGYTQPRFQIHHPDFVECYYSHEATEPLVIYDSINGKAIDILEYVSGSCWYKLAIQSSENGWLKIENLMVIPGCPYHVINEDIYQYKGMWVKGENFQIDLAGLGTYLYPEPNKQSNPSGIIGFARGNIIGTNGRWAKIRLKDHPKSGIEGWLRKIDQCALPYTTCNMVDDGKE